MPEAPLPPKVLAAGILPAGAVPGMPAARPAWLDATTFVLMRQAAGRAGRGEDATVLARDVAAARYPALPAALLSEAASVAASLAAAGLGLPEGDGA